VLKNGEEKIVFLLKRSLLSGFSDGSGSKFFDLGWVGWAIYGLGLNLENLPLKPSNFSIYFRSIQKKSLQVGSKSTWVEGRSASHLLQVKSKLGAGQGLSLFSRPFQCLKTKDLSRNPQWVPRFGFV